MTDSLDDIYSILEQRKCLGLPLFYMAVQRSKYSELSLIFFLADIIFFHMSCHCLSMMFYNPAKLV